MFRTSIFLAIALGITAMGSASTPAAASYSQYFGGPNEHISAQFHPARTYTSPGKTRFRPPSKKRP
jgi:hypothetical protein